MLKNTPVGCFSGKAEKKKNALAKGEFRALRVQFSKATFSKAELAAGGSEQLRCSALPPPSATFEKAAKAFGTGLVCNSLCFVLAPKVFLILFRDDSEF